MPLSGVTIAFDLDGTLVETAPDLIGTLNAMLAEEGLPPVPLASARHLVGNGAKAMMEHGFREAGALFDPTHTPRRMDRFIEVYLARIADESHVYEGVVEALDHFAGRNARLAVATNKRTDLSVALLAKLGLQDRFAAIVGADAVSARKPDPAHLIETARLAGGDHRRMVMVGDSANDVRSARAAGIPVVAVTFGYTEVPAAELGADLVIDHFRDLPGAVETLLR